MRKPPRKHHLNTMGAIDVIGSPDATTQMVNQLGELFRPMILRLTLAESLGSGLLFGGSWHAAATFALF